MSSSLTSIPRPKSAPIKHVAFVEEKSDIERCIFCMRKIFSGAFAEVSDLISPAKRDPLCSLKCLQLYGKTSVKEIPAIPIPIPKQTIREIANEIKNLTRK